MGMRESESKTNRMRTLAGSHVLKGQVELSAGLCSSSSITQVHSEFDSASVQLQTHGVRWLLRRGGHQQPIGPLGHEAQGHVLGLRVQRPWQHHLQIHAAVIAHRGGFCRFQKTRGISRQWTPEGITTANENHKVAFMVWNLISLRAYLRYTVI